MAKKYLIYIIIIGILLNANLVLAQETMGDRFDFSQPWKEVIAIWKQALNWFKNIWNKTVSFFKPFLLKEVEKRKPEVEQEFKKETQEMKEDIPKTTKSLWQRLKELIQ